MLLVPTVRIHLAQLTGSFAEKHSVGFINRFLERLYNGYCDVLDYFLRKNGLKTASYLIVLVSLIVASIVIPPRLKREIIAKPDSPIVVTVINSGKNVHMDQMEELVAKYERRIQEKFGPMITFIESGTNSPNFAWVALHLQDKRKFSSILESVQEMTKEDSEARYSNFPFNPSELPIPNPPDWKIAFRGSNIEQQQEMKDAFRVALLESEVVEDVQEDKDRVFDNRLVLQLSEEKLDLLASKIQPSDLAQIISLTTEQTLVGDLTLNQKVKQVFLKYPSTLGNSIDEIGALPIPIGNKVIPLRALTEFKSSKQAPELERINGENVFSMEGFLLEKEKKDERDVLTKFKNFVKQFREKSPSLASSPVSVEELDSKVELTKALKELLLATAISISLIFLVIFIQFSSVVHSLIIMLAIPFGILGVFLSLYVFNSTLSLNSGLGVILLVGITVANSIMLVEMIVRLVEAGVGVKEAIMETARKRIRPIIMTSLTTILGMFPIALGLGDGGTVLQPLGIAVCGGLWVSLIFTLFIIPALELSYLSWLQKSNPARKSK
jgi:multidrug efflux pump subunit AcrB